MTKLVYQIIKGQNKKKNTSRLSDSTVSEALTFDVPVISYSSLSLSLFSYDRSWQGSLHSYSHCSSGKEPALSNVYSRMQRDMVSLYDLAMTFKMTFP